MSEQPGAPAPRPRRGLFDIRREPFFRPVWRRVVTVAVCLGWGGFEFTGGSAFWGVLFVAIGLYAGWQLFFEYEPDAEPPTEEKGP